MGENRLRRLFRGPQVVYNISLMIQIPIDDNEKNQRLDRFLRKYLNRAPLSLIYKMIRKDVKVNGKRAKEDTMLEKGDVVSLYLSSEEVAKYRKVTVTPRVRRQFRIIYEDDSVLIVGKPMGLLTHGDEYERKNTLVNQVIDYLIDRGDFVPRASGTFKPACVNRLDRNTTGLVIFGKTAEAVKLYNRLIQDKDAIEKYYLAVVAGELKKPLALSGKMVKDEATNTAYLLEEEEAGKTMESRIVPLKTGKGFTLVQVQLLTGRTHQIRLQLSGQGYPIAGDPKYGDPKVNDRLRRKLGLTTQLLHCHELVFRQGPLAGQRITCPPPAAFTKIQNQLI